MRAYRDLMRMPGVMGVTASQLFSRLPQGMLSLAILLHVQGLTDSYAVAGAVVACVSVGEAVAMPVTARLAGRAGMVPTLMAAALINGLAMLGLAAAGSSAPLLMALGVLIGGSVPPLMPVVRALYPQLVTSRDGVRALFAFDTTAQELIWVIGPVAATFFASAVSTVLPLVVAAAVTVLGTCWFLLSARRLRPPTAGRPAAFGGVLKHRTVLLAMVASLALVASFLALEVGIVAVLGRNGVIAGVAIAVASVGSLIGGLTFGHRRLGLTGLVAALGVVAVGTVLFGLTANPILQFTALFASGLGFAPAMSALYFMVSRDVPAHVATEAFGWLNSAALVGGALGTALAGVATDAHGAAGAVTVSALLALGGAVSPLIARAAGPLRGLSDDGEPAREVRDDLYAVTGASD
jgi:MFS family permease